MPYLHICPVPCRLVGFVGAENNDQEFVESDSITERDSAPQNKLFEDA